MRFSMWMLYDRLTAWRTVHNLDERARIRCLTGVLPYRPEGPWDHEHVYLISAEALEAAHGTEGLFFLVTAPPASLPDNCQIIAVQDRIGPDEILLRALEAVERLNGWYEEIQAELTGVPDLLSLCRRGCELLENPIMLFDPDPVMVAAYGMGTGAPSAYLEEKASFRYVLSDDAYKMLVNRPEHEDETSPGRVSVMVSPFTGGNSLFADIRCGVLDYRLCVNDDKRPFRQGDFQLCEILADSLRTALDADHSRENLVKNELCQVLRALLSGELTELHSRGHILSAWNWQTQDDFVCLCMEKTNQNLRFVSNDLYICSRLEELLGDACAFMEDGRIICVIHLTDALTDAEIGARLEDFIKDNIFTAGVSDVFSDLAQFKSYYTEAEIAVRTGRSEKPEALLHFFADYSMIHLFRHGLSGLSPLCFCDPNARKLMALSDARVDYCRTLQTYIANDRNLLKSAELLHIHRTTLFYRLNRIRELIDVDLDDPAQRFRLWLSFILMDIAEGNRQD